MSINYPELLEFAQQLARSAGEIVKARRLSGVSHDYKDQHELVTSADIEVDEYIVNTIAERYPEHRLLSEETYNDRSQAADLSRPIWIIDPIDGTVNYAHGHTMVAISIAFAEQGRITCGVVYNPFMDEMFTALEGQGAHLNSSPINVSREQNLRKALVATGFPYEKSGVAEIMPRVEAVLMHCQDLRRLGSAALDICWVACGRLDAYFESLSPWDFAAARLIALEAGAECGHFSERPKHIPACIHDRNLLITSPALYTELRSILRHASGFA